MSSHDAVMLTKALTELTNQLVAVTRLLEPLTAELEWANNRGPSYTLAEQADGEPASAENDPF